MAKILLVDDDDRITRCMAQLLEALGHRGLQAENAETARRILANEPDVSLVVLDHHLDTKPSGLDLLAELRRDSFTRRLPVLVCSGDSQGESVSAFVGLDISGFIVKPFRPDRFLSEVDRVLHEDAGSLGLSVG